MSMVSNVGRCRNSLDDTDIGIVSYKYESNSAANFLLQRTSMNAEDINAEDINEYVLLL